MIPILWSCVPLLPVYDRPDDLGWPLLTCALINPMCPGLWSRRRSEQVGPSWARSQTNGRSVSRGRLSVDTHFKPLRENPKEEASSMSSSRKWKSMMDVTGRDNNSRSDSSRTNIDSGSSTLPRSKTPNLMRRLNSYPSPTRYGKFPYGLSLPAARGWGTLTRGTVDGGMKGALK